MNKIKKIQKTNKIIRFFADFLSSTKKLTISMYGIILFVTVCFLATLPESLKHMGIIMIPALSGMAIGLMRSKSYILKESGKFFAGISAILFVVTIIVGLIIGLIFLKSF